MKQYRATVKHDNGKINFLVNASSEQDARKMICAAELCPDSAIIKIKEIKNFW